MSKYTSGKTTQKRDKCIQRKSSEISALKAEIDRLNKACDQRAAHEYKLMGEIDALKAQRDVAIQHITEWCVVIEQNGSSWDDWGQYYKDACRDNALPEIRELLDAAIKKARSDDLGVQS